MQLSYSQLPDLSNFEAEEVKQVQKLIDEHHEKRQAWYAGKRSHEEARAALGEAQGLDQRERAGALRAGKKDPGHAHTERARKKMAEIEDRMSVLEVVLSDIEANLSRALSEARGALIRESRAKMERERQAFNETVRAMREAHDAWTKTAGLAKWCDNPTAHVPQGTPLMAVLSVGEIPHPDEVDPNEGTVRLVG